MHSAELRASLCISVRSVLRCFVLCLEQVAMVQETIFSKIIRREVPSDIVYQDELVTAFRDINPQAPTHILIVPNKLIPTANDVAAEEIGRAHV